MWTLTGEDREEAYRAMVTGDSFTRGRVTMFRMGLEYSVVWMNGPVTDENRTWTNSWSDAVRHFEHFMEEDSICLQKA